MFATTVAASFDVDLADELADFGESVKTTDVGTDTATGVTAEERFRIAMARQ